MRVSPNKTKYKKTRKGKLAKLEFKANSLKFGVIGLKAAEAGILKFKQIEAARQAISRKIKRRGKVWIRIFTYLPITAKPKGTRMGKGKGNVSHWGARVRGGTTLFEICGVNKSVFFEALKTGGAKLPIKTQIFD
jgi:large subunit ribosomal protein L16